VAPLIFLPTGGEFEDNPKAGFLQWGIALLALLWFARGTRGASPSRVRTPLGLPLVLFYLACLLSLTRAVNAFEAVPSLLQWGAGGMLCFLLMQTLRGPDAVPRLFLAAALSCGAVSLIGIAQVWLGLDWIPQAAPPAATFANRNMASHFVAICFPSILGLIVVSEHARARVLGVACLLPSVFYLFYTRTLAAWLAVFAVVVLSAVGLSLLLKQKWARRRRWLLGSIAALLAGLSLIGFLSARDDLESDDRILRRLASFAGTDTGTLELRLIFWKNALAMARDHPLRGVGLGQFELQYPLYHRAVEIDWTFDEEHQLERAHNDHLQILAELGLVGFAAWVAIFAAAFLVAWRLLRSTDGWIRLQTLFVCLGITAFLVVACFSFPMERAMPPIQLCALLGMLGFLHVAGSGAPESPQRLPLWSRGIGLLVVMVFLATSIAFVGKAVLSDVYCSRGIRSANAGEHARAVALLEKARRVSPRDPNVLLMLAENLAAIERCDLALETLRDVLRVHPHKVNAISNMGYCSLRLHDYREAVRYFRRALEILADSPQIYTSLGTAHFEQGEHGLAADAYRKAIELARTTPFLPGKRDDARLLQPRLLLARTYVVQGRLVEAAEQYEAILRLEPGRQDVRRLLAELYRSIQEPDKAPGSGANVPHDEPR
jgi:O-antigen ligase/Tfp pilus assembly protein PilF